MKKYILFLPLIGVFYPLFIDDWDNFAKSNEVIFSTALIIQIISISIITFLIN